VVFAPVRLCEGWLVRGNGGGYAVNPICARVGVASTGPGVRVVGCFGVWGYEVSGGCGVGEPVVGGWNMVIFPWPVLVATAATYVRPKDHHTVRHGLRIGAAVATVQ
jgi:hypothetical protein